MTTVFIDSDIILDFIIERKGFSAAATEVFIKCESKEIEGYISVGSVYTTYYVLRKQIGKPIAAKAILSLLKIIQIAHTSKRHLITAITSTFTDMEDAFQHFTAIDIKGIDAIITRNTKDYKHAVIPVYSAEEFVKNYYS